MKRRQKRMMIVSNGIRLSFKTFYSGPVNHLIRYNNLKVLRYSVQEQRILLFPFPFYSSEFWCNIAYLDNL